MRCSWDYVFGLPALGFLNALNYRIDRNEKEKAEIERFKQLH